MTPGSDPTPSSALQLGSCRLPACEKANYKHQQLLLIHSLPIPCSRQESSSRPHLWCSQPGRTMLILIAGLTAQLLHFSCIPECWSLLRCSFCTTQKWYSSADLPHVLWAMLGSTNPAQSHEGISLGVRTHPRTHRHILPFRIWHKVQTLESLVNTGRERKDRGGTSPSLSEYNVDPQSWFWFEF